MPLSGYAGSLLAPVALNPADVHDVTHPAERRRFILKMTDSIRTGDDTTGLSSAASLEHAASFVTQPGTPRPTGWVHIRPFLEMHHGS